MPAAIFSGSVVKTLKDRVRLLNGAELISLAVDPRSVATSGAPGSLLINHSTGDIYKKRDSGSSTNWTKLGVPGGQDIVNWEELGNSPMITVENSFLIYKFGASLDQELYSHIVIPPWYSAGSQIKLNLLVYFDTSAGDDFLIQSQSTLIRSQVDVVSSTTNQRTSTNVAITSGAGNVNEPQKLELDLTDSSGQINSVSVSPLDLLKIRVYRGADDDVNDLIMLAKGAVISWV